MKTITVLPKDYSEIFSLNLQKNKKTAVFIHLLSTALALLLAVPMHFHVSIFTLFTMEDGLLSYVIRFLVLLLSMIVYIFLHELVHGITMKYFGTQKVRYGFTGLYAFAGSEEYYGKKAYSIIALAPVVVFGILLGVLNFFVPTQWFWVIYLIQIINLSGAAGDLYVTAKFSKFPKDIYVKDTGVEMTVYAKQTAKEIGNVE